MTELEYQRAIEAAAMLGGKVECGLPSQRPRLQGARGQCGGFVLALVHGDEGYPLARWKCLRCEAELKPSSVWIRYD